MVCSKVLKKWQLPVLIPKREVRLWSPAWVVYPPNGTCGYLITGTLCRRHGLFMYCLTFDFRTQDGWRIDWQRLRKEGNSVFCFLCFFSCLDHPFLLGLAIIPRKMHFENDSSQITFIIQAALLGTVLPEWKGIWCSTTLTLYYVLWCVLMLNKVRWKRMPVGEKQK